MTNKFAVREDALPHPRYQVLAGALFYILSSPPSPSIHVVPPVGFARSGFARSFLASRALIAAPSLWVGFGEVLAGTLGSESNCSVLQSTRVLAAGLLWRPLLIVHEAAYLHIFALTRFVHAPPAQSQYRQVSTPTRDGIIG